ncbi:MAG: hypothetical protein HC915_02890 [Anaerolineae bacterium]|nr:hypothetical protein [Anaerolineae bacterium]
MALEREYTESELWEHYQRFLEVALPVAEAEGITLALHPNDPPVPSLAGVPGLFRSIASFQRAFDLRSSAQHGIILCLGSWAETGEDLFRVIEHFGQQNKLSYCHFQSVRGSVPRFEERFIDDGDYDPMALLLAMQRAGFTGAIIPGHVPQVEGDIEWRTERAATQTPYKHPMGGYRARAYTVGFIKGMLAALPHLAVQDTRP